MQSKATPNAETGHRFRALDSLRGIAAAIVVFEHLYLTVPADKWALYPVADLFLSTLAGSGRFAVILFFVLSGFVLSLPYLDRKKPSYKAYLIRRIFRLYVPYLFAVFLSAFLCAEIILPPGSVTPPIIASHVLMTGVGPQGNLLNGPLWTLIIEMRVSIIFPLLVVAAARFGWGAVAAGTLGAYGCYWLNLARGATGEEINHYANDAFGAVLMTVRYLPFFLFGIIMAARLKELRRRMERLSLPAHALCCASIFAFHLGFIEWGLQDGSFMDIVYGLAASYFILGAVALAPVAKALANPVGLWLGDISYSLYLIHFPVSYAALAILYHFMPHMAAIVAAVPVILISAWVMHRLIERPAQNLGRRLAR